MKAAPYFRQSFMKIKSQSNMVKRMLKEKESHKKINRTTE
jgi:hypothetical protein